MRAALHLHDADEPMGARSRGAHSSQSIIARAASQQQIRSDENVSACLCCSISPRRSAPRCLHSSATAAAFIFTHINQRRATNNTQTETSRARNRRDTRFAESFFRFTHRRITRGVKNIAYFSCVLYCIYAIESARRRFLLYCKVLYIQYCIDVHLYCTDLRRVGTRVVV